MKINMKKIKIKELIVCIAIPLLVGILASLLTMKNMDLFGTVQKPPLAPPAWLFPVVWTILYVMMGIASYLIYSSFTDLNTKKDALCVYSLQLIFNFGWSLIFFNLQWFYAAFVWLIILWILILITILRFRKINQKAAWLLLPYLIWVTFAGYLNLGIAILN